MQQTLLVAGLACLIAAVVGGGLKAFGIEIPALKSGVRQVALGVLGALLLAGALIVGRDSDSSSTVPDTPPSRTEPDQARPGGDDDPVGEQATAPEEVPSDFAGGSTRAYAADFAQWPRPSSEHGSLSLGFGNSLVLQPASNTWIGPGRPIEVTGVDDDFVCDLHFRMEERNPSASLKWDLRGSGDDAAMVELIFSVRRDDRATYSLNKNRVRSGGDLAVPHIVRESVVAEREQLPGAAGDHDWSTSSELTLKREGGQMQFFVNDRFVEDFTVSLFPVREVGIGAANESRIEVVSMECRVKP